MRTINIRPTQCDLSVPRNTVFIENVEVESGIDMLSSSSTTIIIPNNIDATMGNKDQRSVAYRPHPHSVH